MLVKLKESLLTCARDSTIKVVILQGAGEKGFCAGGDMKTLYDAGKKGEAVEQGEQFFTLEYEVDEMVYQFNKPRSINSLTYDMLVKLKESLLTCARDSTIKVVILQGAGEKGFCAGGDMKTLYDAGKKGEAVEQGEQFFTLEYEVDEMVYQFNKPIVACLDGIVMGGGVGLAY